MACETDRQKVPKVFLIGGLRRVFQINQWGGWGEVKFKFSEGDPKVWWGIFHIFVLKNVLL